jgi:hypothetical protein
MEEVQMADVYVKKCSTTLVIRNSNQSYIYIPSLLSRMAIIKKRKTVVTFHLFSVEWLSSRKEKQ